jgi:hypothetical protein
VRRRDAELQLDAAHALEGPLRHHPLRVQEVADDAERRQHDGRVEEHRSQDEGLHVARPRAADPRDDEAGPDADRQQPDDQRQRHEDAQRLVLRVDPEDRDAVAPHVGPHRSEQT